MTKAKTKTKRRRVWLPIDWSGKPQFDLVDPTRRGAQGRSAYECQTNWAELTDDGWRVIPATLTWTPPAKVKKRRAKR